VSEETSQQMLRIMRANVTGGSGKSANIPGLSVGGKTGTGEKYDPAIRGYNHQRQVSSFAAVFPTEGADRGRPLFRADPAGRAQGQRQDLRLLDRRLGGRAGRRPGDRPHRAVPRRPPQSDIFTVAQQPPAAPEAGL
jgi:cell division protein FtsI (penicillin-binding protein 3)